ncbi:MAG: poly[(R)-3-hydroxyalkanoate] polymerase subunit PhaC, partial [Solirubrobacteraceae bacterium]|nr:poly[(R)-3-hydroxyalkanoate] polymerase subunit PhaC [Solirubrobacteraceae bacterium]
IQAADGRSRFMPGGETARLVSALARRPGTVARRAGAFGREVATIAAGSSERAPARGDRRFADEAWRDSWFFRRLVQGYLAVGDATQQLIDDAHLDWDHDHRVRFLADNVLDAIAPTNFPLTNPTALKATIDRGGANFVAGARALARDARSPAKIPANVDRDAFQVGVNLAATPGAVVAREKQYELLQFQPTTDEVREAPLVIVPPMISKYYVVDLSPSRSLVEYLVGRGQQVFAISWRNPTAENRDWGLDSYVAAIIEAIETARRVTGAGQAHVVGLCAGGVASACTAGRLADIGELDGIAGLTLNVTVLDTDRGGTIGSFVSPDTAAVAVARVQKRGYLDKNDLARTFAWLRPNDMIWNYWVNNYLLGLKPPAFDLLYWNADSMDMPAGLHGDFVDIGMHNPLVRPGGANVLGSPIDLSQVTTDTYIVAGETDHITQWPNCYRTTGLLGGEKRFILSTGGHIAATINPPGNPKATYRVADRLPPTPEEWLAGAELRKGTWWDDWDAWLAERSGEARPAPKKLGNRRHKPLGPAPGEYVLQT